MEDKLRTVLWQFTGEALTESDNLIIEKALGMQTALIEQLLGRSLQLTHSGSRAGDVRDSQADQGNLRRLFPEVQPVPLDEGLRNTIAWFEES